MCRYGQHPSVFSRAAGFFHSLGCVQERLEPVYLNTM